MPARSRKRRPSGRRPPAAQARPPAASTVENARSRSEERNEAIRAGLVPLAPGERPWPLRVAVVLAVLIGIGDLVQAAIGGSVKLGGTHTSVAGVALFAVVMLVCAVGMWQLRYWAVLGFEALLALIILAFSFVLVTATDLLRGVIALAVMGSGGFLFYKLVRVLSRLQLPSR